jgi:nicotinamide-nucleotide amidase
MISPGEAGTPAAELIALLIARQQSIAVAESLTGGLLAGALTDVPGASAAFRGGVVAYATELKAVLLGVDRAVLAAQGAVSAEVAGAMAAGVRDRLGAPLGAATTGWLTWTPPRKTRRHGVHRGQRRGKPGYAAGPVRQPGRHPRRNSPRSAGVGPVTVREES